MMGLSGPPPIKFLETNNISLEMYERLVSLVLLSVNSFCGKWSSFS